MAFEITIVLEDEQVEEAFENAEVKVSKAKMKKLKELVANQDLDIKEALEERFAEFLEDIINEEWGE